MAEGVMEISFPIVGTDVALTSATINNWVSTCNAEIAARRTFIIYPNDGLDVDSLSSLLASLENANVAAQLSTGFFGVLFWRADLTPAQVIKVTQEKQTLGVEVKCTDDCKNPSDRDRNNKDAVRDSSYNKTMSFLANANDTTKFVGRDLGQVVQPQAPPELSFISWAPSAPYLSPVNSGPYYYDASAGRNAIVYILDCEWFDLSLPEFDYIRSTTEVRWIGRPGVEPDHDWNSHGTGMLALIAGADLGVAKISTPRPFTYDYKDGKQWMIVALDEIYTDWVSTLASGTLDPTLNPFAVLSMSFGEYANILGPDAFETTFSRLLKKLNAQNVLSVTSAGNEGSTILRSPAIFGDPLSPNYVPNMLVIGAVDNFGVLQTFSNLAGYVRLYAPGKNYEQPFWLASGGQSYYLGTRTSGSCAKTAGLAAYLIGLTSSKTQFPTLSALSAGIRALAWERVPGSNLLGIYNNAYNLV